MSGAGQQNVDEMLLTALAGIRRFERADGFRDVAGEYDADRAGFGGDGEISFARNAVVDLQKIDAAARQSVHGVSTVIGGGDGYGSGRRGTIPQHGRTVDEAGRDDLRNIARDFPSGAPGLNHGNGNTREHLTHAGDPVGDQQREVNLRHAEVRVHIPQAGDQKFSFAVDDHDAFGRADFFVDHRNALAIDGDGESFARGRAGGVDYGDVFEDDGLRRNPC